MKNFKLNPIVTVLLSAGSGVYAQTATLPPVVITANPFTYAVSATDAGTRTNTPIEKIPQSVVVITKDIIDDQGAKTLSDVLRNASNVTAIDERDSNLTGFRVRGFAASTVIDGVQTPGVFHNQESVVNVESISVLKGPNGGLFGGSQGMNYPSSGGVVYIKTPEPTKEVYRSVGAAVGSYNLKSTSFDLNQPVNDVLAFRLIGEYSDKNSETEKIYFKRQGLYPSIALTPNSDTKIVLKLKDTRNETLDYPGLPRAGTNSSDVISGIPRSRFIGTDGLPPSVNSSQGANLQWTQRLNPDWDFKLTAAQNKLNLDQVGAFAGSVIDAYTAMFMMPPQIGLASQDIYGYRMQQKFTSNVLSPSITGKFKTGQASHTLSAGIDYEKSNEVSFMKWSDPFGIGLSPIASNVNLTGVVNPTWVEPSGASLFDMSYDRKFNATTSYLQDQLEIGQWTILGSVRFSEIEIDNAAHDNMMGASNTNKKSSHTTPRVGATYSFSPKVHGFVGYGEAVQTPYLTNFAAGVSPTPEKMKQIEYGVKFKDFYGVNGTVSVFDVARNDVATSNGIGTYLADQGNKGVDVDLRYKVAPGWQWIAAYTHQDPKYTGTQHTQVASYVGRQLFNVPKEAYRLATRYDATEGVLKGWGAGLGLTHHSQLPGNGDNDFFTQSATVWDARISFVTKSAKFGAYVNNLTNTQYMKPSAYFGGGQLLPNAPRTFMLSAQFYL